MRCLNRTSVGLKPHLGDAKMTGKTRPQSNQRGIETLNLHIEGDHALLASIEPAWD